MSRAHEKFMIFVGGVALAAFGAGICMAARYTLWVDGAPRPAEMPGIISYFVSAVNGTLAANLGAVLGIAITPRGWQGPTDTVGKLQWFAAAWYVAMLVLAAVFWGLAGFTDDQTKVVSLLPEMTKNGVGIFIAILAAVLGVQTAITRLKVIAEQQSSDARAGSGGSIAKH
jgi:MFS family permease